MTCGLAALTTFPSGYSQLRQEGKSWLCTTNYPDGQRYRKYSMSKRKRYQSTMLVSVRWARSREGGHLRKATTCQNSEEVKWNWGHVVHSCPTLCDPMDYTVHGILQARMLEWVAFPFSRGSSQLRNRNQVSCTADGFCTAEPQGSPRILEWVAYPFSSIYSWPRNRTGVSCIAGRFFTNWAIRESQSWFGRTEFF